eukprot:697283-Pyramimonas_sp.AAC.1
MFPNALRTLAGPLERWEGAEICKSSGIRMSSALWRGLPGGVGRGTKPFKSMVFESPARWGEAFLEGQERRGTWKIVVILVAAAE